MEYEIIEWRKEVTLTMLAQGKDLWEIKEAIKELEPVIFGCNQKDKA
ncbi:MAG: hypothetical protein J6C57_02260 [Paludibacteraceae bacterium]|nr:hypothetical protein [Paludibacteraceae bacterium]